MTRAFPVFLAFLLMLAGVAALKVFVPAGRDAFVLVAR